MKEFLVKNKLTLKFFGGLLLLNSIVVIPVIVSWYAPLSKSMEDVVEGFGFLSLFIFSPSIYLVNGLVGSLGMASLIYIIVVQSILLYGVAFIISKSIQLIKTKSN